MVERGPACQPHSCSAEVRGAPVLRQRMELNLLAIHAFRHTFCMTAGDQQLYSTTLRSLVTKGLNVNEW